MIKKIVLGICLLSCFAFGMKLEGNHIIGIKGEKIEAKEYKRIVVLDPAFLESCYMLGAESKVVAIGKTARSPIWPVEKTSQLESVGTITKPSLEVVLSKNPDLVILNSMVARFGVTLKNHDIPVITNHADNIDEIIHNIKMYGIILGKNKEAEDLFNKKRSMIDRVKNEIEKDPLNLSGGFLYSTNPLMAFGEKTLPGEILDMLGVHNIAKGVSAKRPIMSPEYVLKENPDFLFGAMSIKKPEDILSASPLIRKTKAGKNKNVFLVSSSKLLRPSPGIIDEIESLYQELKDLKRKTGSKG